MNTRALKVLVAVMGVVLVAGVAVLVVTVAERLAHRAPPAAAFSAPAITLPKGAKIEAMSTGTDRIALDILLVDGTRQLVVIDLATGDVLGTIPLREAP
jgi:hypothetical protein